MSCQTLITAAFLLTSLVAVTYTQEFDIVNGQIFTPGLAIVDSPQPNTPMGGDSLQVALDISGNGRLPQPPYAPNVQSGILNITMFLYSYTTGLNLTITNGTKSGWSDDSDEEESWRCGADQGSNQPVAGCKEVLLQESGSTVKHVNFVWPDCMVGDGGADNEGCGDEGGDLKDCLDGTARGPYNISIHQNFRMNGSDFYTIFDLPIQVTNSISKKSSFNSKSASKKLDRPLCALRNNPLLSPEKQASSTTPMTITPWVGNGSNIAGASPMNGGQGGDNNGNGGNDNGGNGDGGNGDGGNGDGGNGDGGNGDGGDGDGGDGDGGNGDGGDGTGGNGNGNGGPDASGNSANPQPTPIVCATIDDRPVTCTEAPQTGVSLTNLVPNSAIRRGEDGSSLPVRRLGIVFIILWTCFCL